MDLAVQTLLVLFTRIGVVWLAPLLAKFSAALLPLSLPSDFLSLFLYLFYLFFQLFIIKT